MCLLRPKPAPAGFVAFYNLPSYCQIFLVCQVKAPLYFFLSLCDKALQGATVYLELYPKGLSP